MQENNKKHSRRQRAYISILGTTQLHLRNPLVIAWWSAAFPGLGHLLLSKYLRGFLLFGWEIFINYKTHLNLAILYSFIGNFEMAKEVVNIEWMLFYIPTYIFAIWDSYTSAVDMNHNYILAVSEDAPISILKLSAIEINYLDKRTPLNSVVWSTLVPGAGQLYIHRVITAFFIFIWWIVISYFSKLLPAIHFSLAGDFELAKAVIVPQWFLNLPSLYLFAIYDSYVNTVENNKLFDWEQGKFLKREYQNGKFEIPLKQNAGVESMYVISTFEHSKNLELAITAIQMKGIKKENILAVPMDKRSEDIRLFDTIHSSDGLSLLDLPTILGTVFMIFGSIYGFVLTWGPILWALLGLALGFGLGLIIKLVITKRYSGRQNRKRASEVVIIIKCNQNQTETVKDTLWAHYALGVRKLDFE